MLTRALFIFLFFGSFLPNSLSGRSKPFYTPEEIPTLFEEFKKTYNKNYGDYDSEIDRKLIFKNNVLNLNKLNSGQDAVFGVNQFSDIKTEEFLDMYTGLVAPTDAVPLCIEFNATDFEEPPEEFDWRMRDAVTSVKFQGTCRSSWAFSAIAALESQWAITYGSGLDFSEQQLVDCDAESTGCEGGWPISGYMTLSHALALSLEHQYPYEGVDINGCREDQRPYPAQPSVPIVCESINTDDEELVKKILYHVGPLSIGIDATGLKDYHLGVIENCASGEPNHAALLVGYGIENDIPFWVIKNSWDKNWGQEGYVKIQRGNNTCNVMATPVNVPRFLGGV